MEGRTRWHDAKAHDPIPAASKDRRDEGDSG